MASNKRTAQVEIKVTGQRTISDIEKELESVNQQLKDVDINSQAFSNLSEQSQKLNGELQNVNKQLEFISPAEQADGFLKMGEGILGAVTAVEGLSAAFGVQNEEVEETIKRLVGMVAALDGIRKVSEALQRDNIAKLQRGFQSVGKIATTSFNTVSKSLMGVSQSFGSFVGATEKGVKSMNTALTGFVITAILVAATIAVQQLIKHWDDLVAVFNSSKRDLRDTKENLEGINDEIEKSNNLIDMMTERYSKFRDEIDQISRLDPIEIINNKELFESEKTLKRLREEQGRLDKGSVEYLDNEVKINDILLKQQEILFGLASQQVQENDLLNNKNNIQREINLQQADILDQQDRILELKRTESDIENNISKIKNDTYLFERGRKKDLEEQQELLENVRSSLTLQTKQLDLSNAQLVEMNSILLEITSGNSPLERILSRLDEIKDAAEKADEALSFKKAQDNIDELAKELRDKLAKEINSLSDDIELPSIDAPDILPQSTVDGMEKTLLTFVTDANIILAALDFGEELGQQVQEFVDTYLAPTLAEIQNLIDANANLFAAQQEHTIALAELEIDKYQEVVDAKKELQAELDDQIKESQKEQLSLEDLLKDANAERYAEIQEQIKKEQSERALLEEQKRQAEAQAQEANRAIIKQEYDIALAEWQIRKSDMEASKVQAGIDAALAVLNALSAPFPLNLVLPAIIGLSTAKQISAINQNLSTLELTRPQPPKAKEGMLVGPSHDGGGIPIEAEGGEFIINRRSTDAFLPLIQAINNWGRPKYADGGSIPNTPQGGSDISMSLMTEMISQSLRRNPPVVSVVEITNRQNRVSVIENNAGF